MRSPDGTTLFGALVAALALGQVTPAPADGPPAAVPGGVTVSACLAAVRELTGSGELVVLDKDYSEANSAVMVGVGPDQAPWRCLVSNDGAVAELSAQ